MRSLPRHRGDRGLESVRTGDQAAAGLSEMRRNGARSYGAAPSDTVPMTG